MRKIIFVCIENAGRSQMAEEFFNYLASGTDLKAESAGVMPAEEVYPTVVEAMQEKSFDISKKSPKEFNPVSVSQYERIIVFNNQIKSSFSPENQHRTEEWDVADTKDKSLDDVRNIRDEIEKKAHRLFSDLMV